MNTQEAFQLLALASARDGRTVDIEVATVWAECKRRAAALTKTVPNTVVVDFLRHSPITDDDDHYWDGMHTTVATADRVASDLKDAVRGELGPDYRLLSADETP